RPLERARAAEPLAALEHEHGPAGAREVGGRGEAVVAAADHDDVPALARELGDRRGQPDLAQTGRDLVPGSDTSWSASASTATAWCARTITGLSSMSASGSPVSRIARAVSASLACAPSSSSAWATRSRVTGSG